ncbi:MAG: TonB-dependent receptor domain-containing protein [Candidatus Acidiferrales bacterium]
MSTFLGDVEYATYLVPNANIFDVRDHQASVRVDHRFSNTDDFYGRYLIDDLLTPRAPLAPAGEAAFSDLGLLPEFRTILQQRTQSLLLNERHYFVNSLNEFRFSYTRIHQDIGALDVNRSIREFQPAFTVTDNFGGFGAFQGLFPAAGIRFTVGRDSRPTETTSNVFQVQDNFSFNRGRHGFKLGVNFVRVRSGIRSAPTDLGQYFYGEASFGIPGLELFMLPNPFALAAIQRFVNVQTDSSGDPVSLGQDTLDLREFDQFYFFQDDIRVNPRFTLSLGLRYELPGQPINGIRSRLNPSAPRIGRDKNNFAPRIGFAWSPWQRTVVRGGYGIMYNQMPLNIPLLLWQSGPISPFFMADQVGFSFWQPSGTYPEQPFTLADVSVRVANCTNFNFRSGTGGDFSNPTVLPVPNLNVPLLNCFNQDQVDPGLVNPYVQHYSLTIQQELTPSLLLDFGWVGSKGTKLYQRVDVNPYCFEGDLNCFNNCAASFPDDLFCQDPRLAFRTDGSRGAVTRVTNGARSTYNAFQVNLTKRMTRTRLGDFTFTGSYTWSHNIDYASEIFGPGVRFIQGDPFQALLDPLFSLELVEAITPLAQDPRNASLEKGSSAFDRRQRATVSYIWEIAPDKGFWKGGWQVSGIVGLQSGQPFTPLNGLGACADFNGDGRFTNDRPSVGNPDAPSGSVALLVDADCRVDAGSFYVDLQGNPIDPSRARFVQTPIGLRPGDSFTVGSSTFRAGSAGRNILTGPGIANVDIAFYKNFRWGEGRIFQLRWEIYDLFNTPNPGSAIGNVFATDAQPTPGFAFFPSKTPARVTGVIPENLLNASDPVSGAFTFLSRAFMNTSSRRMQFGVKFIF